MHTSPLEEMLAITFFVFCLVGRNLVEDKGGAREDREGVEKGGWLY